MSLPVQGAWIEIAQFLRSAAVPVSLPVQGAWIEMLAVQKMLLKLEKSLPVQGAWIEIAP